MHCSRLFYSQSNVFFSLKNNSDKIYQSSAGIFNHLETQFSNPLSRRPTDPISQPQPAFHPFNHPRISDLSNKFPPSTCEKLARRLLSTSRLGTTDVYELLIRYTRNSHAARSLANLHTLRSLLETFLFNSFHSTENSASERN